MAVRLTKPWLDLTPDAAKKLSGQLGVYQLAGDDGEIAYIGFAGGRSLHGLRGELSRWAAEAPAGVTKFRYEVNTAYRTRHHELVGVFRHDNGRLPRLNDDIDPARVSNISPG
jgi:hypothetical protein